MYHPLFIALQHTNKIGKFSLQIHEICPVRKIDLTHIFSKLKLKTINVSDVDVYQSKEANQICSIIDDMCRSCKNIYNQLSDFYHTTKTKGRQHTSFMILSDNFYLFGDMLYCFELICKYAIGMLCEPVEQIRLIIPKLVLCQNILTGQLGTLVNQKKRMYTLAIAIFFCYLGLDLIINDNIDMVNKKVKEQLDNQFQKLLIP